MSDSAQAATVFAALGDVTRLALIERLEQGKPQSIRQLCTGLTLTRQGVTKHLRVLEQVGLVRSCKVGRESRFTVDTAPINEARDYLATVSRQWDAALERLQHFVEE